MYQDQFLITYVIMKRFEFQIMQFLLPKVPCVFFYDNFLQKKFLFCLIIGKTWQKLNIITGREGVETDLDASLLMILM